MMTVIVSYDAANGSPIKLSIPANLSGFVASEDAGQFAEGFRREFNQEPTPLAVREACIGLAKQRRGLKP